MATTARKLNFMIDNEVADELEKTVPTGRRSKVVTQAIARELTLQRRKRITSRLVALSAQIPQISGEKLRADLRIDRSRG
jgi:hypothetical protein